jgi:hypothetical protein
VAKARTLLDQCELAVSLLPPDTLADRRALSACLAEELRSHSDVMAEALEEHWQAAWEKSMAGKFIDLPGLQN